MLNFSKQASNKEYKMILSQTLPDIGTIFRDTDSDNIFGDNCSTKRNTNTNKLFLLIKDDLLYNII